MESVENTTDGLIDEVNLPGQDWLLETLVAFTSGGLEMGITLNVGGLVISGHIISGVSYFDELSSAMANASGGLAPEAKAALSEWFASYKRMYDKPDPLPSDWQEPRPGYIHMKNARIYVSGQRPLPSNAGMLWRGKLSAVDAFSLGILSAE